VDIYIKIPETPNPIWLYSETLCPPKVEDEIKTLCPPRVGDQIIIFKHTT
jgi:hypothetical protein